MERVRKIIHIDMDAFYAAIEQRDHPFYRGKPLIIGGDPKGRGVVATCSYEARRYGIHSAMPSKQALKQCPNGIFIRGDMPFYKEVSKQIHLILRRYTDIIEPISLDEAYLDVTTNKKNIPSATLVAQDIQRTIYNELHLTASAGVSYNKFLAKIASDFRKPAGLTVVTPEEVRSFLDQLPIEKFHGVGKITAEKMRQLGIKTGADLRKWSEWELIHRFHKRGYYLYRHIRGFSSNKVNPARERKSVGKERTFEVNVTDEQVLQQHLRNFAKKIESRLNTLHKHGKTIVLKLRYSDFTTFTKQITLANYIYEQDLIYKAGLSLLKRSYQTNLPIRLIGLAIANLKPRYFENLRLEGL